MKMHWADTLIIQYEEGRKDLQKRDKTNISDQEKVNSMISSMTYAIDWMKVGRDPDVIRGIDVTQAYQKQSYGNMDLLPMALQAEERELTKEEKKAILDALMILTPRERECFVLGNAYMMSRSEIGKELGISKSSVQKYVERARKKISCHSIVVHAS